MSESIQQADVNTLSDKLTALELNEGERSALNALLMIARGSAEVEGFMMQRQEHQQALQRMQQNVTGPDLAGILTNSGLFSMAPSGNELTAFGNDGST